MKPFVSIICAFLNEERFLAEAIESVRSQSFTDFELILVDDGSTDRGSAIARRYEESDSRVRYLEHPKHANRGASPSRNLGLEAARGDFIAIIDADDLWMPTKLAQQLSVMKAHPQLAMVCGAARYWSSWCGGVDKVIPTGHLQEAVISPPHASICLYPLGKAAAPCPSDLLMRQDILKSVGGFEEEFVGPLQLYEDQAFLAKLYLVAPVYFSKEIYINYRQHPESCVSTVRRDGRYHEVRMFFLRWLERYIEWQQQTVSSEVKTALQRALSSCEDALAQRK